jgi:hypothetical protein
MQSCKVDVRFGLVGEDYVRGLWERTPVLARLFPWTAIPDIGLLVDRGRGGYTLLWLGVRWASLTAAMARTSTIARLEPLRCGIGRVALFSVYPSALGFSFPYLCFVHDPEFKRRL